MSKLEVKTSEEIANQLREIFHRYLKHETTDNYADYVNSKAETWVCEADLKQQLQERINKLGQIKGSLLRSHAIAELEWVLGLLDGGQK